MQLAPPRYSAREQYDPSSGGHGRGRRRTPRSIGRSAAELVDHCLSIAQSGALDGLLGLMHSDELVLPELMAPPPSATPSQRPGPDAAAAFSGSSSGSEAAGSGARLRGVLERVEQYAPALHLLDSYAIRNIVLQRPATLQVSAGAVASWGVREVSVFFRARVCVCVLHSTRRLRDLYL